MDSDTEIDLNQQKHPRLFESEDIDLSHIRVRPSEFARMMGCSKQAVSIWIRDGKVVLGGDGRLDPSQAVAQLLKNSNPNQLRLKALAPLIRKQRESDRLIQDLKNELSIVKDDEEFYEGAIEDFLNIFNGLKQNLQTDFEVLERETAGQLINAIISWLDEAIQHGSQGLVIADFLDACALEKGCEGEG
jgi:hypothetical protein